jgi:hypothetical protein
LGAIDVCRRYARLPVAELLEVDYRSKTFSCSVCGGPAWLCVVEPAREHGMEDYRLDEREKPARHPAAVDRLTGRTKPRRRIDFSGLGDQRGRKRSTVPSNLTRVLTTLVGAHRHKRLTSSKIPHLAVFILLGAKGVWTLSGGVGASLGTRHSMPAIAARSVMPALSLSLTLGALALRLSSATLGRIAVQCSHLGLVVHFPERGLDGLLGYPADRRTSR